MSLRDLIDKRKKEVEPSPELTKALNTIMTPGFGESMPPMSAETGKLPQPESPKIKSALDRFRQKSNGAAPALTQKPVEMVPIVQPPVKSEPIAEIQPTGPVADIAKLRANLDYLAANIEQKELVGQVVRTIAIQLRDNPQFKDHMGDGDFDLIIRGLRRSYQIAARNKTEKRAAVGASNKMQNELETMMKDMGL